ncbi:ester cyclase [Natrinema sp. 1APR25-10V2]|uniref:ester cyclase n=1 Tax=Natrinema sp. 1APR25-10V2 TaxID=2951081 RepID=UPI002875D4A7|nr:ester cyclase [Natrinema sp. 1APR25-10V2]MDS0478018.1 ester cyclase [Natrinema sp. 1APR25-10V2]
MDRSSSTEGVETAADPAASTIEARNERLVRDYFAAVWNDGDLEAFDTDAVSDDYVLHHGTDDTYTIDELRTAWADWYATFPDLRNDIEDVIATADRVVVRYRFSGTHEAAVFGVPATGTEVETAGIVVFSVDDHQIVEGWALDDVHGLLQQLGSVNGGRD